MKIFKLSLISLFATGLLSPALTQAAGYEDAVKSANASLDQAKAVNYEWRDSRKLLKKAEELKQKGESDKAMQLVAKAKKQGELATAQAQLQSRVSGPR